MTLKLDRNKGFTLVELLVAILIGAILMISVVSMFIQQARAMALQEDLVNLEENLRAAMNVIYRDIRLAGLYISEKKVPPFPDTEQIVLTYDAGGNPLETLYANGGDEAGAPSDAPDAIEIRYAESRGAEIVNISGVNLDVCDDIQPSIFEDAYYLISNDPDIGDMDYRSIYLASSKLSNPSCSECNPADCYRLTFPPTKSSITATDLAASTYDGGRLWNSLKNYIYHIPVGDKVLVRVNSYLTPAIEEVVAFGIINLQITYIYLDTVSGNIIEENSPYLVTDQYEIRRVRITLTGETRGAHSLNGVRSKRTRTMTTEVQVRNLFY